jgi:hypothetical protein
MKKLLIICLLLGSAVLTHAQIDTARSNSIKKRSELIGHGGNNEIKFNLAYALFAFPEITYERILEDNMGLGFSLAVSADKDNSHQILGTPYYRLYFGNKKANGFFIEGNAAVAYISDQYKNITYKIDNNGTTIFAEDPGTERYTTFGLGLAIGGKLLTRNGFFGEIYLGGGRLFLDKSITAYPRAGITIGKRFGN